VPFVSGTIEAPPLIWGISPTVELIVQGNAGMTENISTGQETYVGTNTIKVSAGGSVGLSAGSYYRAKAAIGAFGSYQYDVAAGSGKFGGGVYAQYTLSAKGIFKSISDRFECGIK
jgi:hypothetical protein